MPSQGLFLTRQFYSFLPHLAMGIKKLHPHRGYLILHGIEIFTVHTHCDFAVHVGFCLHKSRQTLPILSLPFCSLLNRFSPMIVAFYKLFHILPRITTMTGRCRMSFCLHLPSYVFNYRLGMFHFAADSLSLSLLTTKNNNMSNQKDCDKRVCLP